jgi:hypothetical protein
MIIPFLKDDFVIACLRTPVTWSGFEFLIGACYFLLLVVSFVVIKRKRLLMGFIMMFYSTAFCLFFCLRIIVPKIEGYSQAPAINFYKSVSGKDVYVTTLGFFSYGRYFYFEKPPGGNIMSHDNNWLLNGNIDKPVYIVAKSTSRNLFDEHPDCVFLKQEGGFIFYCRSPH